MKTEESDIKKLYYQAAIRSLTDYMIVINRNYEIIQANELFIKEFGMLSKGQCYNIWKDRNEKCEECLVEKTFQDGRERWNLEDIVMKDGRITQMLVKATPVKNGQGKIVHVIETATDITEKDYLKRDYNRSTINLEKMVANHLEELQKSEKKYRTIFERSRDAIILTDTGGRIMEINQAGIYILGYKSHEEVMTLESAADVFGINKFNEFKNQLLQNGFVVEYETRLVRKNNRKFDALITSNVMVDVDGQIIGYVMIIRDITRRKSAQQQIEQRNIRLNALNAISKTVSDSLNLDEILNSTIEKSLDVLEADSGRIYLLDDEKQTLNLGAHRGLSDTLVSKSFIKSRKPGDGLLGQTLLDGEVKVIDNVSRPNDRYVDSLIEEGLYPMAYIPLVSKGKSMGVMSVSSHTPSKFSSEYIEFLTAIGNQIGVAVDHANLYENIKRAYKELKVAQEQIVHTQKLASLGKLSATIAHEINNPLAAVLTYIRLMIKLISRNRFSYEKLEDISRYLTTMESEIARCGEIVKNLLQFSRESSIKIENHSIADIIEKALIIVSHDLKIREIRLKKRTEPNLPKIQCDSRQIQQALLNLIYNASEAMDQGGILKVTADRSVAAEGFIEIAISDTGYGIPKQDMGHIFEPFFTTKEEGKGVGLGLSVAYGIITRHHGTIEVESELNKGSVFKVCLPYK